MRLRINSRQVSRLIVVAAASALPLLATNVRGVVVNSWIGFPGTDVWGNASNWNNGNVPNSTEQATIYAGPTTLYAAPPTINSLLVAKVGSAGQVFTNGFKLNVLNAINLDGANAGLYAYTAPSGSLSVQAPTINVLDGGLLTMQMSGSKVRVSSTASGTPNGTLTVDPTSTLVAYGTLDTSTYTNNGLLKGGGGPSTINASAFTLAGSAGHVATIDAQGEAMTINATTFSLHGTNTTIDASDFGSSLTLNGDPSAAGNVGSDVYVGDSASLTPTNGFWGFGYYQKSGGNFLPIGSVNLNGGPTLARAAKINAYATYFTSVNVTGYANMISGEFDGASSVNVASNSYLYIGSPYFRGTTFSNSIALGGSGTIQMNGDTQIGYANSGVPYTVVNVGAGTIFNWDGTSDTTATCSIENGELNINTSTIDVQTYFNNIPLNNFGYDGTINVAGDSKLNVAGTAWTLFGTMNLHGGALVQGQTLTIDGSSLQPGVYSLYPKGVLGTFPTIQAPVVLKSNSLVYLDSGDGLNLNGATNYAGGQIYSGPFAFPGQPYGIVTQNGAATVSANSTVYCNTFDMDGGANSTPWTINAGVTFTQQAWNLDAPNSTTNPFHSTMTINGGTIDMETNAGLWTLAGGTLNLNGSGFNLPFVTHDKLVLGTGLTKGTINVGPNTSAYISGGLVSGATTVAGGNVINVGANSNLYVGPSFASDANAQLTKSGPGTMVVNVPQNHGVGSTINVIDGALNLNSDAGGSGPTLALNATGGTINFTTRQHLNSLTIGVGGKVNVAQPANLASRVVISTGLAINGGLLDLTANDMIVHNADLNPVRLLLQQGYNGGAWNGTSGITSSAAAASLSKNALGYVLNNNGTGVRLYPSFDGENTSITDVLVKYTVNGDANLDGTTNFNDLVVLAQNYGLSGTTWQTGDFNYDGVTNFNDLVPLAQNYNAVLSFIQATDLNNLAGSNFAADFALAQSFVPEPTTLCMLGLVVPAIVRRRSVRRANR